LEIRGNSGGTLTVEVGGRASSKRISNAGRWRLCPAGCRPDDHTERRHRNRQWRRCRSWRAGFGWQAVRFRSNKWHDDLHRQVVQAGGAASSCSINASPAPRASPSGVDRSDDLGGVRGGATGCVSMVLRSSLSKVTAVCRGRRQLSDRTDLGLRLRPLRVRLEFATRVSCSPSEALLNLACDVAVFVHVDFSVGSIATRRTDKRSTPSGCPTIEQICAASLGLAPERLNTSAVRRATLALRLRGTVERRDRQIPISRGMGWVRGFEFPLLLRAVADVYAAIPDRN
jgi:hypothetical protein